MRQLPSSFLAVLCTALALAPAAALADGADAGTDTGCVVRVVSPVDRASDVSNTISIEFSVSQPCTGTVPVPTLRDPNGALVQLDLTQSGSKLVGKPLGYLIDGVYEVDPISRSDECGSSNPARITHFRIGAGPAVRAITFTAQDKYTSGSPLESVEIFLSEPLKSGTESAIPTYVTVSGLEPGDIYYVPETTSILWSWKSVASGIPPTTTEKVTIRVKTGLSFASGKAMAADFELSVFPKNYLVHSWWTDAEPCAPPTGSDPTNPTSPGGISCSAAHLGSPLGLAAAFLLAPLLVRLSLRRRG